MPAYHVVMLIGQLANIPDSRMYAQYGGNPELKGWDTGAVLLARTHNLIASIVAGLGGKKVSLDNLLVEFPKPIVDAQPEPTTLAGFISQKLDTGAVGDFFTP